MNAVSPSLNLVTPAPAGHTILWMSAGVSTHLQGEEILKRNGYPIQRVPVDVDASCLPNATETDLVILELADAESNAMALCRRLSDSSVGAVLVIGPRMGVLERVAILEFGADGVLPHSVHPIELLARVRALLRRLHRGRAASESYRPAVWRFEATAGHLRSSGGGIVRLSPADADLLLALATRPGQLVDRSTLVQLLHDGASPPSARSIDARVARLRRAISPCGAAGTIRTVRGRGYVWDPSPAFELAAQTDQATLPFG